MPCLVFLLDSIALVKSGFCQAIQESALPLPWGRAPGGLSVHNIQSKGLIWYSCPLFSSSIHGDGHHPTWSFLGSLWTHCIQLRSVLPTRLMPDTAHVWTLTNPLNDTERPLLVLYPSQVPLPFSAIGGPLFSYCVGLGIKLDKVDCLLEQHPQIYCTFYCGNIHTT